jgi:2,4-dienoyl-CoA reductase-like NADH-dependent reductase (Old Yellow Enzyme family)
VRFPIEVIDAIVETIGAERKAARISPWSKYQGKENSSRISCVTNASLRDMGMKDPLPTFTALVERVLMHTRNWLSFSC